MSNWIDKHTYSPLISSLKALPRFEGSHCPSQSNHEYVKRVDKGSYIRLSDVIKILIVGEN